MKGHHWCPRLWPLQHPHCHMTKVQALGRLLTFITREALTLPTQLCSHLCPSGLWVFFAIFYCPSWLLLSSCFCCWQDMTVLALHEAAVSHIRFSSPGYAWVVSWECGWNWAEGAVCSWAGLGLSCVLHLRGLLSVQHEAQSQPSSAARPGMPCQQQEKETAKISWGGSKDQLRRQSTGCSG